jgi:hypothetical protein
VSACGPRASSFSRGRSDGGQAVMGMVVFVVVGPSG